MMGIVMPETCWASNKICNKKPLLHLVGILFPHITEKVALRSVPFDLFLKSAPLIFRPRSRVCEYLQLHPTNSTHTESAQRLSAIYWLPTWCTNYYLFIKYYSPLHVSSLKCSSSGGYSCTRATYGTVTLYEISWWPVGTQLEWELIIIGESSW